MKKIIKFIKNNILGFLVGLSLCLNGVVIAENILTANQVTYNDSTVQTELDNLFDAVDINERLGDTTTISSIGTDGTVSGAISTLNTNLSGKQATITGGASTITNTNLEKNRALISNGSGKVAVSDTTRTELGYLSGATSNIQTQINNLNSEFNKVNSVVNSNGGGLTYYKKFGNLVIGCLNAYRLIYQWNPGVVITNNPLPKPIHKITISIQQYSDGSLIPAYINTDGNIILGATAVAATELPLSSFFMYYTAE